MSHSGKQVKPSSLRSLALSNVLQLLQQGGITRHPSARRDINPPARSSLPPQFECVQGSHIQQESQSWARTTGAASFLTARSRSFSPNPVSKAEPSQPSDKSHFSHLHSKSHPPGPGYPRHMLKREGCKPSGDNLVIQELLLFSQSSPSSPWRSSWVLCIKDWAGATQPLCQSDASATEICSCKRSLWRVIVQD